MNSREKMAYQLKSFKFDNTFNNIDESMGIYIDFHPIYFAMRKGTKRGGGRLLEFPSKEDETLYFNLGNPDDTSKPTFQTA